jgi:predicted phage terminase large subunit-like protein
MDTVDKIQVRAEKARTDFREFCRFVLDITPAKHQKPWVKELQKIGDNPAGKSLCIIAPPGSGKTQLVGVGFTAWMIGKAHARHYGLLSYSDMVGWARSFAVRNLIENSLPFRLVFPEVLPEKKRWGTSEFLVKRADMADPHPTLRAGGLTSAVVAYRLNGLVVDDPHDQKNSATTSQLDKAWRNWEDAISTRLTSDAWQVTIGTRWNDQDYIGRRKEQKGVKVVHTKALNSKGESYWPEHYPTEFLLTKKYQSPALFAMQYQGDTTGGEAQIIRNLATYDYTPQVMTSKYDLVIASGWDTAFKEKQQNDFSVGFVGGMDKYGRIYVLDKVRGRWGLPALLDTIAQTYNNWPQFAVWVEDAASGTPAVQTLMSQSTLPVEAVYYRGGKTSRAHALAPYLHGGHVLFPKYASWFPETEYDLTHFPNTDHDDELDALFLLVDNLIKLRHPSSAFGRPSISVELR